MTAPKPKLLTLTCAYDACGQLFEWVKKRGRVPLYCSPECRTRAFHLRNPDYKRRRYHDVIAPARRAARDNYPAPVFAKDQMCSGDCGRLGGAHGGKGRCQKCN